MVIGGSTQERRVPTARKPSERQSAKVGIHIAMPVDPKVLDALKKAVEQDHDSVPLRLYFASLLLVAGDAPQALAQFAQVLERSPDSVDALRGAASAAATLGQKEKAHDF